MLLNPYLNFDGKTEAAFNFYKSVLGGEITMLMRFKDSPEAGKVPAADADKIMHASLPIGKGNILMATDMLESMGQKMVAGNNFHLSLSTDSKGETDRIFNALAEGGKVSVPLANMFWGSYFGMLTDKFGVQWMISYDEQPNG